MYYKTKQNLNRIFCPFADEYGVMNSGAHNNCGHMDGSWEHRQIYFIFIVTGPKVNGSLLEIFVC